ncbi:MAG: AmmeMemoRadiSam system protein A [Eubacteriaceae bacterium]
MADLSVFFMPHPPVIIPEIGGGQENRVIKTIQGMHKLGKLAGKIKPKTIIYVTPHGNNFSNGTCILNENVLDGNFSAYGHPDIKLSKKVNQFLSMEIFNAFERADNISVLMDNKLAKEYGVQVCLDNGTMVPMYYINQYYNDYEMVHIAPGFTSLRENYYLGQLIQSVAKEIDESVLLVCSGDLSHALMDEGPYDYHPSGDIFDKKIQQAIIDRDPLSLITMDNEIIEQAGQCGLRSFLIGFGYVDGVGYESKVISYEGPFGVGYLTGFLKENINKKNPSLLKKIDEYAIDIYEKKKLQEDEYIKLARKSIETYVKTFKKLNFEKVKDEFSDDFIEETKDEKSGVFVSIHIQGNLRGCIGTIYPSQDSLIEEIIYNSINACSNDPRFNAVEEWELLQIDIKVDVLGEPEFIQSIEQLDIVKYGVIVEKGSKSGLLLPNLEGINSVDEQIEIAMNKANINNKEGMKLYRFEVIRHER